MENNFDRKNEQVNTVIKHKSTNNINLMRVLDDMIVYFPGVYIDVLQLGVSITL